MSYLFDLAEPVGAAQAVPQDERHTGESCESSLSSGVGGARCSARSFWSGAMPFASLDGRREGADAVADLSILSSLESVRCYCYTAIYVLND